MRRTPCLVAQVLLVLVGLVATGCTATAVQQANESPAAAIAPTPSGSRSSDEDVPDAPDGSDGDPTSRQDADPVPTVADTDSDTDSGTDTDSDTDTDTDTGSGGTDRAPTAAEAPASTDSTATPKGSSSSASAQGLAEDIRTVDFENGFVYENPAYADTTAVVADGEFANGELGDEDYFWFAVNDVVYGDLDDDGVEEAVVVTGYSGGGSGFFQSVRAFGLVDGVVTEVGVVQFGDRAFGGVADVIVEDGIVSVLTFLDGEGSCCPSEAAVVRLVLGEHFLTQADTGTSLTFISLSQFEEQRFVKFLPGTSGAYASMWPNDLDSSFSFEAGPGQVLTVEVIGGPAPSTLMIVDTTTGERVGTGASAVLPSDAIYEIDVGFDDVRAEPTTLLVQIDAVPDAISWVPAAEQVLVSSDPFVHSSLAWPVFSSAAAGRVSVAAANEALATLVVGTDDLWIEDVTEFSPQDESSFELNYEVSYAEDGLVSVRFGYYDYVCCRPHPNYGTIGAVLDLQNGRLIEPDEILTLDRVTEINQLWLTALEAQGLLPAELFATLDPTTSLFESVGLVPEGIEFGTGRNALGGGTPGTLVVLTFDELGDLVQPSFRDRVAGS